MAIVTNIISLDTKLKLTESKKAALIQKRKILAVKKVFQCMQCAFKCEKCGTQIGLDGPEPTPKQKLIGANLKIPYRLCESCSEEYIDYINRLKGKGDTECYWHNEAWLAVWKQWIDFRGATDRYLKSKEFKQLLQELRQSWPDKPEK